MYTLYIIPMCLLLSFSPLGRCRRRRGPSCSSRPSGRSRPQSWSCSTPRASLTKKHGKKQEKHGKTYEKPCFFFEKSYEKKTQGKLYNYMTNCDFTRHVAFLCFFRKRSSSIWFYDVLWLPRKGLNHQIRDKRDKIVDTTEQVDHRLFV